MSRHPCTTSSCQEEEKYRVLPCKTYISVGSCPYRERCVYLHDPRVGTKSAKSSNRRKNKDSTAADAFYWPNMNRQVVSSSRREKPNKEFLHIYSICVENMDISALQVHSIWEHFVDTCRGSPSLNPDQSRSVHTGRRRLKTLCLLSQGKRPCLSVELTEQEQSDFVVILSCKNTPQPKKSPKNNYSLKNRSVKSPVSVASPIS